jgi:hypothetical protein
MSRRPTLSLLLSLACLALLAAAVPASAKLVGFQTPDKKVGCYVNGHGARCDVRNPEWPIPPTPPECELDYGQGVEVGRRSGGDYVCAGDTTLDRRHDVLEEGDKVKAGRFKCKNVGDDTIKCVNTRLKTGFAVSRATVSLF